MSNAIDSEQFIQRISRSWFVASSRQFQFLIYRQIDSQWMVITNQHKLI